MNKELTPLEALADIKDVLSCEGAFDSACEERCNIVETALKEYKLMKQTKIIVVDKEISDDDLEKLINQRVLVNNLEQSEIKLLFDEETQKKFKAFEIIKSLPQEERQILLNAIYTYTKSEEEYDLLKEIL